MKWRCAGLIAYSHGVFVKVFGMIERAKNIWAALKLALGRECDVPIELNEEGEQMVAQHMELLAVNHIEASDFFLRSARVSEARRQRLQKMLDDPAIEADEIVQHESEHRWKQRVCDGRKSVRTKVLIMILFAVAWLCVGLFGPQHWNGFAVVVVIVWLFVLAIELDGFREDAEASEVWRQSLTMSKAGDKQKAMELLDEHVGKLIARTDKLLAQLEMSSSEKIEAFIRNEAKDEPRK